MCTLQRSKSAYNLLSYLLIIIYLNSFELINIEIFIDSNGSIHRVQHRYKGKRLLSKGKVEAFATRLSIDYSLNGGHDNRNREIKQKVRKYKISFIL